MKKVLCLLLFLIVSLTAKPSELLIEKKISHKENGNLQGYKTVEVNLYEREDLILLCGLKPIHQFIFTMAT